MNNKCSCASGFVDSGATCVDESTLKDCGAGFYNDGADECRECGTGCSQCSAFSGKCTKCVTTKWFVSSTNP